MGDVHVLESVELGPGAGHVVCRPLPIEDGIEVEAAAPGVDGGGQHVVRAHAAGRDERSASTLGHREQELELAHLVAAVGTGRAFLPLHPEAVVELFDRRREPVGEGGERNEISETGKALEQRP